MDVRIDFATAVWDTVRLPSDTLLTTTVGYTLSMSFGTDPATTWFTGGDPQSVFIVDHIDVSGQTQWRLVAWRFNIHSFWPWRSPRLWFQP